MKSQLIKLPFGLGRVAWQYEREGAAMHARAMFQTNLRADLYHRGKWQGYRDLGSGLVTDWAAMAIVNEAITLASPSGARINTLFLANYHTSGKGVTAADQEDFKIETASTVGGQTAVAGTQSVGTATVGTAPVLQTVATIAYTGTEAVTEWLLNTASTQSSTTGSPFTAATATTATVTGTPLTASSSTVQGQQQNIVVPGTTTVVGLVASNTTSVLTLFNNGTTGWFNQSNGAAGSTPGGTETYTFRPIPWDHKVFSAINVVNGDSIQFTYRLTVSPGG